MTDPDRTLLEQARAGDVKALDDLLARYQPQVFRYGLRMCGNEEDARDVLQETLLSAFRNLHAFRGDAQLSTWLYQIARSFCLRSRRLGSGEPGTTESLDTPAVQAIASSDAAPDAQAHAKQLGSAVQAAILALSPPHREVIILRDVEGLTAEEAAQAVGVDVGALKSRLHRARIELREHLARLLEPAGAGSGPCPELAQELSAYAGAEIDQAACVAIEQHLARCKVCAQACDQLKRTVSLCKLLPGSEVPAQVQRAVRQALRSAIEQT